MTIMMRHKRTGEVTPATPAMKRDVDYEPIEVEPHRHLFRVDSAGIRYDRFGINLDFEQPMPSPKPRKRSAKKLAADVSVSDLLEGLG